MHWAVLRVSIMFRNSIPVFVQYHLLISLDSVQVRFLTHPKTTSLALAHVHNMATLALKLSGRSLLYSKSASFGRRPGPSELYPLFVFARAVPTVIESAPDSHQFICPTKVFEHEWHFETLNWLLLGEGNIRDSEYASSYPAFTERTAFDFLVCGPTCQSVT